MGVTEEKGARFVEMHDHEGRACRVNGLRPSFGRMQLGVYQSGASRDSYTMLIDRDGVDIEPKNGFLSITVYV